MFAKIALVFVASLASSNPHRPKRVFHGEPVIGIGRDYLAVKYYAWIGNAHDCDCFGALCQSSCSPSPFNLVCSGALVTPRIVQTACHCLVLFGAPVRNVSIPKLRSHFEMLLSVQLGSSNVSTMTHTTGILSRNHLIHLKCRSYSFRHPENLKPLFDYGWVELSEDVSTFSPVRNLPISYAPAYTLREMAHLYDLTMLKGSVCLYVGFGSNRYPDMGLGDPRSTHSFILQHGWNVHMTYLECYLHNEARYIRPRLNYTQDVNWGCLKSFPKNAAWPGGGDSGGPVTCNRHYVGVVSHTITHISTGTTSTIHAALVYAVYENALEYRRSFISAVKNHRLVPFMDDYQLIPVPGFTKRPDDARRFDKVYNNNGVHGLFPPVDSLMILLLWIFTQWP